MDEPESFELNFGSIDEFLIGLNGGISLNFFTKIHRCDLNRRREGLEVA